MENIIKRIIDIENKAKDIVSQAEEESAELPEIIKRELDEYISELEGKLEGMLKEEKTRVEETLKRNCDAVSSRTRDASELLLAAYSKHGENCAEKLFEKVTKDV